MASTLHPSLTARIRRQGKSTESIFIQQSHRGIWIYAHVNLTKEDAHAAVNSAFA